MKQIGTHQKIYDKQQLIVIYIGFIGIEFSLKMNLIIYKCASLCTNWYMHISDNL